MVKGPQVTREYYNAAGHTALAKIKDGEAVRHRMGDLGYFDERGRLWFCGRKSQRVRTADGTLFTVPCESVFNTHPEVFRTALVGVGEAGSELPVLCVELEEGIDRAQHDRIRNELLDLGAGFEHTRGDPHRTLPSRIPGRHPPQRQDRSRSACDLGGADR